MIIVNIEEQPRWKDAICKLCGIKTYADELLQMRGELYKKNEELKVEKMTSSALASDLLKMEKEWSDPIEHINSEKRRIEAKWLRQDSERRNEINALQQELDKQKALNERMWHRGHSDGWREAFGRMGIICIDAHKDGKDVVAYFDEEQKLTNIEVTEDQSDLIQFCNVEEINIDELVDVGVTE